MSAKAMDPVRVLIVDDSAPVRRLLVEALGADPGIEVVGTAANGEVALLFVRTQHPDAIVLDLEMPVMNGLEFLAELRDIAPWIPVVVFTSLTSHGAEVALQALWLGAADYVTKPRTTDIRSAREQTGAELLPRIKAMVERVRQRAERRASGPAPHDTATHSAERLSPPRSAADARIVAIAASTGGPKALAGIVGGLPNDLRVPVLVVQHMPPMFTGYLADGLESHCGLAVSEAYPGARLGAGQVWIAPGGHHMVVRPSGARLVLELEQGPPENGCRPSADPLLRSVAEQFGPEALAVVLTGMGQDGTLGCRAVRQAGGRVIAQDEATSVIWGMPGSIVREGLADFVLPLESIAAEIARLAGPGGRRRAA